MISDMCGRCDSLTWEVSLLILAWRPIGGRCGDGGYSEGYANSRKRIAASSRWWQSKRTTRLH